MIGNAWWTESSLGRDDRRPPRVTISISGESVPPESSVEWSSTSGKPIEPGEVPPLPSSFTQEDISSFQPNAPSTQTFIGRGVGKQLFISDDKQKKVEALVKIVAQGTEDEPERVLGVFPSKPIKVISKPSKKRQSAKNMECRSSSICNSYVKSPPAVLIYISSFQYASTMVRQFLCSIVYVHRLCLPSTSVFPGLACHSRGQMVPQCLVSILLRGLQLSRPSSSRLAHGVIVYIASMIHLTEAT
jgi:hypothetical protein